ncbi:MAG: glycine cleavage system protein H [Omnitrophica WOR_2 bacterium SM23_29]|nr:MAG: glycine cleavage system protein H [Omnitrophica WOR_2 bacterium SM23_29]
MVELEKLRFTKTHEWLRVEGDIGYIGITDHAQKEITDVVFVELPSVGKELPKGQEAAVVESVKAAFSLYAPVSGKVVKANDAIEKDPSLVNKSPYEDGWLYALEIKDKSEIDALLTYNGYLEFIKEGEH